MANFNNELKDYQSIPRALIFDNDMSDRARFLFCYMASKPDNWNFYIANMTKELGYSDETLRKYINELISCGWLIKGEQSNLGKFGAVEYTLKAKKTDTEKCDTEKIRYGENPAHKEKDNYKEKDNNKEIEDKSSTKKVAKINWRGDYAIYKDEVYKARDLLLKEDDYKAKITKLYPNIDYHRSILKSVMYWESDKGWECKKKSQSNNIDMVATIKKNIDKSVVFQNKNNIPIENEKLLDMEIQDEDGNLGDGTFFKNGRRWYYSNKEKRVCSINIKASPRPSEEFEYDSVKDIWYIPKGTDRNPKLDSLLW